MDMDLSKSLNSLCSLKTDSDRSDLSKSQISLPVPDDEEIAFSKDFVYNVAADTTVQLKDGRTLKFNKAVLVANSKSTILFEVFFGSLRVKEGITDITDCDYDSFKKFIDCIMGFEKYDYDNAFQIFPIVWKYQIQNIIAKCIKVFEKYYAHESKQINRCRILDQLNMAAFLECDALIKQTLKDLFRYFDFFEFFEKFYLGLNPDAMKAILHAKPEFIDSQILKQLLAWGDKFYIKNNDPGETEQNFLDKYDLMQYFKLEYFETAGALFKFCDSDIGKNLFSTQQILNHLRTSVNLLPGNSEWKRIKQEHSITEEIMVVCPNAIAFHSPECTLAVKIERNKVVLLQENKPGLRNISCRVNIIGEDKDGFKVVENKKEFDLYIYNADESRDKEYFYVLNKKDLNGLYTKCFIETFTFKLKWKFLSNCRVLLTDRPGDALNDPEKMYFTKNVSVNSFNRD